jgi:hypothetical protein
VADNDESDKAPDEPAAQSFLKMTSQLAHGRDDGNTTVAKTQSFTRRRIQEDLRDKKD